MRSLQLFLALSFFAGLVYSESDRLEKLKVEDGAGILNSKSDVDSDGANKTYKLEGKVSPPTPKPKDWTSSTKILIDGGKYVGHLRADDSFMVHGVPSGSYLVEVFSPDHYYEPARVDISSKGKMRARKVNNIKPNEVNQISYPLKMKTLGKLNFFQKREEWRITDILMNPMILMMVLPLLLITALPKMMSDPETQKEMQEMQKNMHSMQQNQLPEMSQVMANLFGGGAPVEKKKKPVKAVRR